MKKILAICLALLLLLSGCGVTQPVQTTAPADGPVTFTWGGMADFYDGSAMSPASQLDAEYTAATGNVRKTMDFTYELSFVWAQLEGDEIPTVFQIPYDDAPTLIRNRYARNIQALLDERGWGDELWNSEVLKPLKDENGDLYGIPASVRTTSLLCNKQVFRDAGLVDANGEILYPTTWEEVRDAAVTIREKTGLAGLNMSCNDRYGSKTFINVAWCYGAELTALDADGKQVSQLNHPGVIEAMKWYRELVQKVGINTDVFLTDGASCIQSVAIADSGMCFCEGELPVDLRVEKSVKLEDLVIIPLPSGTENERLLATGYCYWFRPDATDDQIRAALDFIEMYGASPIWNEEQYQRTLDHAAMEIEDYGRYFPEPRVFSEDYLKEYEKAVAENEQYIDETYLTLFRASMEGERLRLEVSEELDLYRFLMAAIQELSLDPKKDIQAYMDEVDQDFQQVLDMAAGE